MIFRRARPFEHPQVRVRAGYIKRFRIERASKPFLHRIVLFMLGVAENLQQILVAPRPAAIVRRAGALSVQAHGDGCRVRLRREDFFHDDGVLPGVSEIIFIMQNVLFMGRDIPKGEFGFVQDLRLTVECWSVDMRVRKEPAAHLKLMQVAVGPAHRQLNDRMEPAQAGVAGHG